MHRICDVESERVSTYRHAANNTFWLGRLMTQIQFIYSDMPELAFAVQIGTERVVVGVCDPCSTADLAKTGGEERGV